MFGAFFVFVVALFGLIHPWWAFYFTLFVTPMFLFGGIFFPYDRLPHWAQSPIVVA